MTTATRRPIELPGEERGRVWGIGDVRQRRPGGRRSDLKGRLMVVLSGRIKHRRLHGVNV